MGFLSRIFSDLNGPDETQEAMIDAVCLAVLADGQISDLEGGYVEGFIAEMIGVDEEEAAEYAEEALERLEVEGAEGVLERIADVVLDEEDRDRLFQAVAFVQLADDSVVEGTELLSMLAASLDLSVEQVETLLAETRADFELLSEAFTTDYVDSEYFDEEYFGSDTSSEDEEEVVEEEEEEELL